MSWEGSLCFVSKQRAAVVQLQLHANVVWFAVFGSPSVSLEQQIMVKISLLLEVFSKCHSTHCRSWKCMKAMTLELFIIFNNNYTS